MSPVLSADALKISCFLQHSCECLKEGKAGTSSFPFWEFGANVAICLALHTPAAVCYADRAY